MRKRSNFKKTAKEMSDIFDVDIHSNVEEDNKKNSNTEVDIDSSYNDDYNEKLDKSRSFIDKCDDIKYIMEHEQKSDNEIIDKALEKNNSEDINENKSTSSKKGNLQELIDDNITKKNLSPEKSKQTQDSIDKGSIDEGGGKDQQEKNFSGFFGNDLKFYNE